MTDDETVVLRVHGGTTPPTLTEAAAQLFVTEHDLISNFGVQPIDPDRGIYAVKIRADRLPEQEAATPYQGPFSDPRIATYGPIQVNDDEAPE